MEKKKMTICEGQEKRKLRGKRKGNKKRGVIKAKYSPREHILQKVHNICSKIQIS